MRAKNVWVTEATSTGTGARVELAYDEWILKEEAIPHTKWIHSKEFKAFMFQLYDSFPMVRVSQDKLDENVPNQKVREYLLQTGYIVRVEDSSFGGAPVRMYSFGPNAFPLISAWQTERLTKYMFYVAMASMAVAVLNLILFILQFSALR